MKRVKARVDRVVDHISSYPDIIEISDDESHVDIPERPISRAESVYEGDESIILAFDESILSSSQTSTRSFESNAATSPENSFTSRISAGSSDAKLLGKRPRDDPSISVGNVAKMVKLEVAIDKKDPYVIAHNPAVERILDARHFGHGLRYELARLISTGLATYKEITAEKLQKLQKLHAENNFSSGTVDTLFRDGDNVKFDDEHKGFAKLFSAEYEATSPWKELEREESALALDPDAGVGNNSGLSEYYGGRVVYPGHLRVDSETPGSPYKIELEPSASGPSSLLTRQFGSTSFLRIRIPDQILYTKNNNLVSFFKRRFVLWNNTYRAIYAKEGSVLLFCTNERYGSTAKIPGRLSFEEFLTWFNPLSENSNQLMTKWSCRFALGFSNTIPGPVIPQENLLELYDEMSPDGLSDMTDGSGLTSIDIHIRVGRQLQLPGMPTAVQFRAAGCKGLTIFVNDEGYNNTSWIKLRPSQRKIQYPKDRILPKSLRTIDIVRTSRLTTPTRLSHEVIINLHENGVDAEFFIKLLQQGVRSVVDGLTTWDGPDAMTNLCLNVFRAENISSTRRAREAKGEARVRGVSNQFHDDYRGDDEDGFGDILDFKTFTERSTAWWGDVISGCPATLGETAISLIFAGFIPQDCPVLREKLKEILNVCLVRETTRLRLEVLQSCSALAIPDPLGVLEENQIQVKSSRLEFTLDDGTMSDIIVGDVLVTRNPCKLPSDTRKVQAVHDPRLYQYVDVIVFSIKGKRRLIDYLAGGDYDGDRAIVYWDKQMVDKFQNADEKYAQEPPSVDACFSRVSETGQSFLQKLQTNSMQEESRIHEFQRYLLGALQSTSLVGIYSTWHDKATYNYGYDHPLTHEMAAKFCRVLDSAKTGFRVKPQAYWKDQQIFSTVPDPLWKEKIKGKKNPPVNRSNLVPMPRPVNKPFIMDILVDAGQRELDRIKQEIQSLFPLNGGEVVKEDEDLARPWRDFSDENRLSKAPAPFVELRRYDMDLIRTHVQEMRSMEKEVLRKARGKDSSFTGLHITTRQDVLRRISQKFSDSPELGEVVTVTDDATLRRIRASYAYIYDRERAGGGFTRFPFNVALRELCLIKAQADGSWMPLLNRFCEKMRLDNPARGRA